MINVFDFETYSVNDKLVAYCVCSIINGEKFVIYGENVVDKFLNFLWNLRINNLVIYAHNLTFDGSLILQSSECEKWEIDSLLENGNIYMLKLANNWSVIEFRCSYRLMPFSLDYIAKCFKIGSKMNFPHEFMNDKNLYFIGELPEAYRYLGIGVINIRSLCIEYCFNDVELTRKFIILIYNKISLISKVCMRVTYSISGLSYWLFSNNFNLSKVNVKISNEEDEILRNAYYGGRCEVFGNVDLGEEVYHFDFSGMYAQVMMESYGYGRCLLSVEIVSINRPGFYWVKVKSHNFKIPILCHKSKVNDRLMFTNGEFEGLYWWEELILFENNGGEILEIKYGMIYENNGVILKNFVEKFTEMRNEDYAGNVIGKIIINSLFGRFGMSSKTIETKIINKNDYKDYKNLEILKETHINNIIILSIYKKSASKWVNSNVGLAAAITAKARIKLWNAFNAVENCGHRILYTDTDSLFVASKKNLDNVIIGEVFFDISKIDTKIKNSIFISPKCYGIEYGGLSYVKIKGIRRNSISWWDLKKAQSNNRKLKIKSVRFNKSNYQIKIENYIKVIDLSISNKRIFNKNKKYSRAFNFKDGEYSIDP